MALKMITLAQKDLKLLMKKKSKNKFNKEEIEKYLYHQPKRNMKLKTLKFLIKKVEHIHIR